MSNVQIQDLLRLSPLQQSILKEEIASGSMAGAVSQRAFRLQGHLNVPLFLKALGFLADNTPMLRASIQWEGMERPVAVIHQHMDLRVEQKDWLGLPESQLEELCRLESEAGFALQNGPLVRLTLGRTAENTFVLLWTFHDLVLDRGSVGLLMEQACHVYEGLVGGVQTQLPAARSFKSYLNWTFAQDTSRAEAFWRGMLRDHPEGQTLPGLLRGSRARGASCVQLELREFRTQKPIDETDTAWLRLLAYGTWAVLLKYYFGPQHVVFGTNVDGRQCGAPGAELICGPLANILPFSATVPFRTPAEVWLDQLRAEWSEINQHAYCALDKIREWSEMSYERPLLETAVIIEDPPFVKVVRTPSGETSVCEFPVRYGTACALTLYVAGGPGVSLKLAYDATIFNGATMERLLAQAAEVLQSLVDHPGEIPGKLQVLRNRERRQLLDWSRGPADSQSTRCIHEAFELHARKNPGALAIAGENQLVTYGDLNARANQLARHLRQLNVLPEDVVGVFMARCIDTVVALLAIGKAGGTYLPLDPELPQERLTFFLQDARPAILLTKKELAFKLAPLTTGSEIVCIDSDWDSISQCPQEDLPARQDPANSAYIIYTSGSTGKPKGVVVPHSAAVAHLASIAKAFDYRPDDRVLQFAGLSFDVSIEQILAPLCCGAALVLKPVGPWDRTQFFATIQNLGVTVANVPPAFWSQLADDETPEPGSLRLVVIGGDVMSPETVRRWQQTRMKDVELLNAYGPTEAVITATLFRVRSGFSGVGASGAVPIGKVLPNRSAYVLNQSGELAPIGAWGELFLGGTALARGYLNHPRLTAEKFVPDAYAGNPGERLYRTGDIARYSEDGLLEFMGRTDAQVKIRGFRIELPEIEMAIGEHPDVSQAVVVARSSPAGDKRLVAYVVAKKGRCVSGEALREFVKQKVPEYMVPALIQTMDCFPLTASGKVDRNQLPAQAEVQETAEELHDESQDPVVSALRAIWIDLLGIQQVGVHDDFFDLGGDSLLATQVVSRVQKSLGVEIPLRVIFDSPTIADLAHAAKAATGVPGGQPALQRISRDQEIPLSPAQERLWFLSQTSGQSSVYNMTGAVKLEGKLDPVALERSLTEVVRRHEALRTVFPLAGDHPIQKVLPPYPVHLALTDLSHSPEDKAEAELDGVLLEEESTPVDLTAGPVFRPRLLRLAPACHVLLATLHHIAGDAWSLGILMREISAAYAAISKGKEPDLPPLPYQYPDFAWWQRQLLNETGDELLEYWRKRLGGSSPAPLPQQKTEPRPGLSGAAHTILLPEAVASGVRRLAQENGSTLFMVLLAALKTLLSFYSGSDDIVVGTDIANRNHAGTENIIGFFVNILALRTDLSGNPKFVELLSRVRDVTLDAYQHQDLPYIRLVEDLNPSRSPGESSLFKTFFYMPVGGLEQLELSGLKVTVLDLRERTAKFDLSVQARETAEGILCTFQYKTDLFEAAAVRQIAHDFQLLLQSAIAKPEARLTTLKLRLDRDGGRTELSTAKNEHELKRAFSGRFQG